MGVTPRLRTGGQLVVDALLAQGVDTAYCVPGESYLEVLNALYDQQQAVRLIACRHEGAAAFMAEAHGKLTGRPGICFVTRGPGATNASIGVHTAHQDSTPMILFVGQVGRDMCEREAFQEIDYRRMFGPITKWVAQIDDASRIGEFVSRAFRVALSGRPGPVVLALPEDMLTDSAFAQAGPRVVAPQAYPDPQDMAELQQRLHQARQPLLVLGGSGWNDAGRRDIARFAEAQHLPVATSFRRQDLFDNRHAHYAGELGIGTSPALAELVRQSDLLLVLGSRLGEMASSGYTLLDIPRPRQALVHVLAGAEELGRVYQPALSIQASPNAFAYVAAQWPAGATGHRSAWLARAGAAYAAHIAPPARDTVFDPALAVRAMQGMLQPDAILTSGAGNYTAWAHRYHQFSQGRSQLAPTSGAMGYGVPAAIAAKLCCPDRQVICLAGDGCFLMTSQELATAARHRLAIVFLVFNNGMYATIRMHQERHYPGRVIATDLHNPDFVAYAHAFGLQAERIERNAQFEPALARALAAGGPYLLELALDPDVLTPTTTVTALRRQAQSDSSV